MAAPLKNNALASGTGRPMAATEITTRVRAMLPALRTLGGVALPPEAV